MVREPLTEAGRLAEISPASLSDIPALLRDLSDTTPVAYPIGKAVQILEEKKTPHTQIGLLGYCCLVILILSVKSIIIWIVQTQVQNNPKIILWLYSHVL